MYDFGKTIRDETVYRLPHKINFFTQIIYALRPSKNFIIS